MFSKCGAERSPCGCFATKHCVLDDCVATVSETGHVFVSVMNLTSNPQCVRGDTHMGTVVPVSLVNRAVPQQLNDSKPKTEVNKDRVDFVFKVYANINLSTEWQFNSSSEFVFLFYRISLTKVFRTVRKRTYRPTVTTQLVLDTDVSAVANFGISH